MSAAVHVVWRSKVLWVIHVVCNAALILAIYGWLSIPDRTVLDIVFSAIGGLALLLLTAWLHAGTLEYFRLSHATGEASLRAAFSPSPRRILLFALWLVVLGAGIVLVLEIRNHLTPFASSLASVATLTLRRPISPASVSAILSSLVTVAAFVVMPFLMLQFWKWKWSRAYLITYIVLFFLAAYVPYQLVWWVPGVSGIYSQSASMGVRFLIAYLLAVTGWLILASTLGYARQHKETRV